MFVHDFYVFMALTRLRPLSVIKNTGFCMSKFILSNNLINYFLYVYLYIFLERILNLAYNVLTQSSLKYNEFKEIKLSTVRDVRPSVVNGGLSPIMIKIV